MIRSLRDVLVRPLRGVVPTLTCVACGESIWPHESVVTVKGGVVHNRCLPAFRRRFETKGR